MSQIADFFYVVTWKLKLKVNKTSEGHKNCECYKSNSRIQFIVSRWKYQVYFAFFLYFFSPHYF